MRRWILNKRIVALTTAIVGIGTAAVLVTNAYHIRRYCEPQPISVIGAVEPIFANLPSLNRDNVDDIAQMLVFQSAYEPRYSLAFSSNGSILAAGGERTYTTGRCSSLWLWNSTIGGNPSLLYAPAGSGGLYNLVFSPNSNLLASLNWIVLQPPPFRNRTVRLWDVSSSRELQVLEQESGANNVVFAPQNDIVAFGTGNHTVSLWNTTELRPVKILEGHTADVSTLSYSHDGTLIATAGFDHTIRLWDADSGTQIALLQNLPSIVVDLAFHIRNRLLVYQDVSHTVSIWDVQRDQSEPIATSAVDFSFSPDGALLAVSTGEEIQFWDVQERELLHSIEVNTYELSINSTGSLLAFIDRTNNSEEVGSIEVWGIPQSR
jgi:WD40 repeat protein